MGTYIPEKGDYIAVSLDPQSGHEQQGRRPALVVSNTLFNRHTGLVIACPLTNTCRNSPFHVPLQPGGPVTGFIMVEQVKALDFHARKAKRIGAASPEILDEVLALLDACLY